MYRNLRTGETVDSSAAWGYVLNALIEDPALRAECKEALVEWYFSGGYWVERKNEEEEEEEEI